MLDELATVAEILSSARKPEDVFGELTGSKEAQLEAARIIYRRLSKAIHPDRVENKTLAESTFKRLQELWSVATSRIETGQYGLAEVVHIKTKKNDYAIGELLARGDVANIYSCSWGDNLGIAKVVRRGNDSDLLENEARVLRHLSCSVWWPSIADSFVYRDRISMRRVNIFSSSGCYDWYSLVEVKQAYPKGLDVRDIIWIWRRLLYTLGLIHDRGVVHGGILPTHILIEPREHGLMLVDWVGSALEGERIRVQCPAYQAWYPEGVSTQPARHVWDIAMGARTLIDLLEPESVDRRIRMFLRSCLLPGPTAGELLIEFDQLIGTRRFHEFTMPAKSRVK